MASAPDALSETIVTVVARFRAMVRSVGARRGLLDGDLDEVMQDVRIRLWQAHEAGKDIAGLGSSYMYQTATSAALDLLRRRRAKGGDRTEDVQEHGALETPGAGPHEAAIASDLSRSIEAALQELSEDRCVAVRMHLSGYDHKDIARMLKWTEARARNLLYRGMEDLRRRLTLLGVSPGATQ